jgi:tRNA threonylcarbamoyladenosine biosynthesis protein TsaE
VKQEVRWRSRSPEQTVKFGRLLGDLLTPGDLVACCGPLGAGKTQLIKGIAESLGVSREEPVASPTFVLVREYAGRMRLYHIDAYRLRDAEELRMLGFEEMLDDPGGVVALEWADHVAGALPADRWHIELSHAGKQTRGIVVLAPDAQGCAAVARGVHAIVGESG